MKKHLLVLFLTLFSLGGLLAQRTITGKVVDEGGEALIGASILVKGTTRGTVSDINGAYEVSVPQDASILIVSYTGFKTQEVTLGASNTVDVTMVADAVSLNEQIVTGYGTQQRRDITGSVASIKGEDITSQAVQSFDQALQGRAAGVNINIPNGVLNNPPVIRVRGINSINLSSFPLIVIDGVPTYTVADGVAFGSSAANNPLSNLNPNDIENIEILKDASAAAIYGSRASAGVIIITTKRGKKGRTKVSYDGWASLTQPARLFDLLDAEQYVTVKNEATRNANIAAQQFFLDSINGQQINTDWYDEVFQTGFSHNHSLGFSGGNDNTNYFLSLGYTNQEGMIVANTFERLSGRLNLDHKVSKYLKLGSTIGYAKNDNTAPVTGSIPGQNFATAGLGRIPLVTAPIISPLRADGSYNIDRATNQPGRGKNLQQVGFINPAPVVDLSYFTSAASQIEGSVYADISPLEGLNFRTQYGINNLFIENISFQNPLHGDGAGTGGAATNSIIRNNRWNWQNLLTYDFAAGKKNNFNLLVGNEQQRTTSEGWGASRNQVADPFFDTYQGNFTTINPAGNFQGENFLLSYFGRVNWNFDQKFLVQANLRQDEYSAFAEGAKRGTFWGASAGVTLSEFNFWKNSFLGSKLTFFRLRGSYGEVGNNNGIGDFAALTLYGSGLYGPSPTFLFTQAGNSDLSWESSKKTDIGINFGLLEDRITGEITYFNNLIDGLILSAPQSPSKGIPGNSISTNIGSMLNTGWEFALNGTIIRNRNFTWSSNFNIAFQTNEIQELAQGNADIFGATGGLETANIIRVGESVGSLYVVRTAGVNPANGRRIFLDRNGRQVQYSHVVPTGQSRWTYVDNGQTAPAVTTTNDGVVFGPTLPKWFGAWDNTFKYRGIELNVQLNYAGGNYVYNGTRAGLLDQRFWNNTTDVLQRWQKEGDVTNIPRVVYTDNVSNGSAFPIEENVEKGDFLRVRNITLGYNLPTKWVSAMGMSNFRIYANVNNAFLFTDYRGTDPEVSSNGNSNLSPGVDRNSVPMARTFLFGVNVGF